MSANHLLLLLSARQQGTWQQFKAAVEELHMAEEVISVGWFSEDEDAVQYGLPLYQILRLNLQAVAHVEFFATTCEHGWRITPPTLSVLQTGHAWSGVLCGARSTKLLSRIHDEAKAATLQINPVKACPDQICVIANDSSTLESMSTRIGLRLQKEAPAAILLSLPTVDDPAMRHEVTLPLGDAWAIGCFSPHDLRWKSSSREEALQSPGGLFRFSWLHRREVYFCSRGHAFVIPERVGKYVILQACRRRVIHYDNSKIELRVPATCPPPFLIERALVLCSGVPSEYEPGSKMLRFSGVPQQIARLACALLRQDLK